MQLGKLAPASFLPTPGLALAVPGDDVRCQAHDLRNKLQVVVGTCDLLLAPGAPWGDRQRTTRMIGNIRTAAQDSARIASAMIDPVREMSGPVDLNALLTEEVGVLSHDLLRQNINVHLERAPRLPEIHVDPIWLARTILNLTQNARDAIVGQEGRYVSGLIRFATALPSVAMPRPFVILTIADNGPGMDEATLARIWDPGWSTKSLTDGGVARGYGLASVRAFATGAGGLIEVDSQPGQGTEFTLCLPAVAARG